jgi:hypothetical protein
MTSTLIFTFFAFLLGFRIGEGVATGDEVEALRAQNEKLKLALALDPLATEGEASEPREENTTE